MSIDFCVVRRGAYLAPVSASDEREILRLPERRVITVQAEPRAPDKLKRWYRAMVQLLQEATDRWPNREVAHKELMIRAGFFESFVISADGQMTKFRPQSTGDWDLVQWREYLDRVIPIIISDYVGETRAEFRDRVDRFLGIKFKEAWEG